MNKLDTACNVSVDQCKQKFLKYWVLKLEKSPELQYNLINTVSKCYTRFYNIYFSYFQKRINR